MIYTKKGDQGVTYLFKGRKIKKSSQLIETMGTIDELNSFIGLVVTKINNQKEKEFLITIQKDLYQIMAIMAGAKKEMEFLRKRIKDFEEIIDNLEKKLPKLGKFIIPGGSELAAWFHVLRAVCRRAEREVVKLNQNSQINDLIPYLNRLSDLFFMLARKESDQKTIKT